MSKETTTPNYQDHVVAPGNPVLVPQETYIAIMNVIQEVERKHSKRVQTDKYAFYNRETHERLSDKSRSKMKPEKLQKEYYENIDFEASKKNVSVQRDDLGSAALQLLSEFRGVHRFNVDQGNTVERSSLLPPEVNQEEE